MKYRHQRGLVCAGGVSRSFLAGLPVLRATFGPVVASSLRVARRMSNLLKAGKPAADSSALIDCASIWIAVPDHDLDSVIRQLSHLEGKEVVVCGSMRTAASITAPAARGAKIVTLNLLDAASGTLAAEGDKTAVRSVTKVLAKDGRRVVPLLDGTKEFVFAGMDFCTRFVDPWFAAAVRCFEYSGLSLTQSRALAEALYRARPRQQLTPTPKQREERMFFLEAADRKLADLYRRGSML